MKRIFALCLLAALLLCLCSSAVSAHEYASRKGADNLSETDSDFDGIEDTYDADPNNNIFSGTLTASRNDCTVSYRFDYRWFFDDPTQYNPELSTTSIVLSSMAYAQGYLAYQPVVQYSGGQCQAVADATSFLALHGFQDLVDYNFDEYTDDDVSEIAIGHRKVTYNGKTKHIIVVDVRGTGGYLTEWSSNFDMGDHSNYQTEADWIHYYNHKGFDVAATRALKRLTEYTRTYTHSGDNLVYWVTGHSRGAAIANILSADLIDEGNTVFGYTFATPNTTTRSLALEAKYDSIFNMVNRSDFVPCVPLTDWGFLRYGKTAYLKMSESYKNEWCTATDSRFYNEMSVDTLSALCKKLTDVAAGWDDCYVYHCSCHGDGTQDDITRSGLSRDDVFVDYSDRARLHCQVTSYTDSHGKTKYKVCQQPAFFMQALADVMGADGLSMVSTIASTNLADHYKGARNQLLLSAVAGIADPHMSETYYILSLHADASSFKQDAAPSACEHHYVSFATLTPATCTADGYAVYRCSECADRIKDKIPKLSHNYLADTVTEPTCIKHGYTKYICSRCGASEYKDYTPCGGHNWVDSVILTPATESSTGLLRHTCSVCHVSQTDIIPILAHDHIYTVKIDPPTCVSGGSVTYTCACGDTYTETLWEYGLNHPTKKDGQ